MAGSSPSTPARGRARPKVMRRRATQALKRAVEIREMVARNTGYFALATKADDAARIVAARKRVVYQSMENAYPIGKDLTLIKTFYDLGVRDDRTGAFLQQRSRRFRDRSEGPRVARAVAARARNSSPKRTGSAS